MTFFVIILTLFSLLVCFFVSSATPPHTILNIQPKGRFFYFLCLYWVVSIHLIPVPDDGGEHEYLAADVHLLHLLLVNLLLLCLLAVVGPPRDREAPGSSQRHTLNFYTVFFTVRIHHTVGWSVEFFLIGHNRVSSQRLGMILEVQIQNLGARVSKF